MTIFIEGLPRRLPTKCRFIWPSCFRGEDFFRNQPIRNKNGLWRPYLLTGRDEMSKFYREPSTDASYQVSVHLAKHFQKGKIFFRNQPIRNKNCLWWPCLLMDRDKEHSLQRTFHGCFLPNFSSFGKAVSEEKIFQKSTNQKQEFPVVAMFVN